jgi:hemerythrin-like domain-containing protein
MDFMPTVPSSSPGQTLSEAIGDDHKAFDECYEKLKGASDEATKIKWRNQLTWTIARHAISEELTWYPAMEKYLGEEGTKLAHEDKAQHAAVKRDLSTLQDMSPLDTHFPELLDKLMDDLHTHIAHESDEDMPRLEKLLSREESESLAKQFQRTKAIVPTRAHPSAPEEFPLENLAALLAAPVDRFMDLLFRDFPSAEEKEGMISGRLP